MKKLVSFALLVMLVFGLVACSGDISKEEYDKVVAERDALQAHVSEPETSGTLDPEENVKVKQYDSWEDYFTDIFDEDFIYQESEADDGGKTLIVQFGPLPDTESISAFMARTVIACAAVSEVGRTGFGLEEIQSCAFYVEDQFIIGAAPQPVAEYGFFTTLIANEDCELQETIEYVYNLLFKSFDAETVMENIGNDAEDTEQDAPDDEVLNDYQYDTPFFEYSGSGDDVVTGLTVDTYSLLKVTHIDNGHFAVKAYYGERYDLLINTTDPYENGETLLLPGREYTLEISAKGDWSVEAFRIGTSSTDAFAGTGDVVTPIFLSTSDVYEIIADGGGHFAVKGYYGSGEYKLLVNTTDPYSGKVMLNKSGEYCFFVIEGERDFTITPQ